MNQKMMKKLEEYVQQASYNRLQSITIEQLQRVLGEKGEEVNEFIENLHKQSLIEFKYNIFCPKCKELHTIYERELKHDNTKICICGYEIDLLGEISKGRVLFIIDRNEFLSFCEENDVYFTRESLKIIDLESRKQLSGLESNINLIKSESEDNKKMKIFIGSSRESKGMMKDIAYIIEECGHTALRWDNKTLFPAGSFTMENIVDISKEADAAVFVFSGDDKTWYRGKEEATVRDNVLIEYGLFVGAKGIKHSIFVCNNDPKIPTDLLGITRIDNSEGETHLEKQVEVWLNSILK